MVSVVKVVEGVSAGGWIVFFTFVFVGTVVDFYDSRVRGVVGGGRGGWGLGWVD